MGYTQTDENKPNETEYVCYFIVDLFSGQVPKRRIKTNNNTNNPSAFEQCTSRVLSNCKYCEYCRSMAHTKYHCPLIKPCANCGIKGHKTTSFEKTTPAPKRVLKKPETKQYFPALPTKVGKGKPTEELQRRSSSESNKEKDSSSTKEDNIEHEVITPERPQKTTQPVSTLVPITDPKGDSVKTSYNTETKKKNKTAGIIEMDTNKDTISSNDEASPRKKNNSTGQPRSPTKDPGLHLSPNLQ